MNHSLIIVFTLFLTQYWAQTNLILNGDFEEYHSCPDVLAQIERCKHVTNPVQLSVSSSDYFNGCYVPVSIMDLFGIPNTVFGFQYPRSEQGMVGLGILKDLNENSYNEYVQLSFSEPLICGEKYKFTIYFNLANIWKYSKKGLAFYFTSTETKDPQDYLYNFLEPNFVDNTTLVTDTAGWSEVTFDFVADRPYKYVSFGFTEFTEDMFIEVNSMGESSDTGTYFFADDASLIDLGHNLIDEFQLPNVFTPNGDGINDLFMPIGNASIFDELIIFNRWGNEIERTTNELIWDGTSKGIELTEGVYFYLLKPYEGCDNLTKQGMIHLIR